MSLQSWPKPAKPERNPVYRAWIRTLACVVPRCRSRDIHCAHVRVKRYGPDVGNCVPLCARHHDEQHKGIKTFQRKYGLNLAELAAGLGAEWDGSEWGTSTAEPEMHKASWENYTYVPRRCGAMDRGTAGSRGRRVPVGVQSHPR